MSFFDTFESLQPLAIYIICINNTLLSFWLNLCLARDEDVNNTCKESVADCNANDVAKDEEDLEEFVAAQCHRRLWARAVCRRMRRAGEEGGGGDIGTFARWRRRATLFLVIANIKETTVSCIGWHFKTLKCLIRPAKNVFVNHETACS